MASAFSRVGRRNSIEVAVSPTFIGPPPHTDATDFLDGPLRSHVLWTHEEYDGPYEPKRMTKHEPLQFSIVKPAPVRSGQERPADLDLAPFTNVGMKTRRSYDSSGLGVDGNECSTRSQRL